MAKKSDSHTRNALIIFGVSYLYYQFSKEGATGSRLVSELTADTGTLLIIISFLFSPILYFFNFFLQLK